MFILRRKKISAIVSAADSAIGGKKGYSLVEAVVTIAIIAIISVPLLESFLAGAKMNAKAGRVRSAAELAQRIAEDLKVKPIEEFNIVQLQEETDSAGNTKLSGTEEIRGAGGERFYVNITLDPSKYDKINKKYTDASPVKLILYAVNIDVHYKKADGKILASIQMVKEQQGDD